MVNEADKFLEIGRQALLDGDLETADEALHKAVRIDDTHPQAYLQLGVLQRLQGDDDSARALLKKARKDPSEEVRRRAALRLEQGPSGSAPGSSSQEVPWA